ncbi:MAG: hypothetical protein HY293_01820 [Planctomycetes bacterium]|nr:hypothetical protein [Planctomycetota bacterium]
MLELDELCPRELAGICRVAGEECVRRLRQIAQASDPSDEALQGLLLKMASEARLQAEALHEDEDRWKAGPPHPENGDEIRQFIRNSFTSLSKGFGEGRLHRDIALFYAESLEEEAARFYRVVAEHAREAEARSVFAGMSDRERGKLRFLREVVLQS